MSQTVCCETEQKTQEFPNWPSVQFNYLKELGYSHIQIIAEYPDYFIISTTRNGETHQIHVTEHNCWLIRASIPYKSK